MKDYGGENMNKIFQTKDNYIFQRYCKNRIHKQSIFHVNIYPGIIAEFGEPKSKLGSKKYQLTQLLFSKKKYSEVLAKDFVINFHVKYVSNKMKGKKLAPIYKVIGNQNHLIHGGYILICKNTSQERATFINQNSYDYWKQHFYDESVLCSDKETINAAIPLLIDRIKNSDQILKDMPTTDHRIFEELIAEVFNGFGYTIELTKKTRDGGKDIVALKKKSGKEEKILIECKHWKDTVDVKEIRSLVGVAVGEEELPTGVILATTSRFSTEAKNYVLNNTIKIDLERKDYDDILEWIHEYDAIQFSKQVINTYFKSLCKVTN